MFKGERPVTYGLYIGGQWVAGTEMNEVYFPYDSTLVGYVPEASREQVEAALQAAEAARPEMAGMPAYKRAAILSKAATLLEERKEHLAQLLTLQMGKHIRDARVEVSRAASTLQFSAEAAKNERGETIPIDAMQGGEGRLAFTLRKPVGVVAAITGFNFPLLLDAHKIGPAIAAGNTVVLKPSPFTPMTAYEMAEILTEAGLPAGALNVVTGGAAVGEQIVTDPRVKLVTFTGSAAVGKRIQAAAGYKRVLLELGSNAAVIVEPDGDTQLALNRIVQGGFGTVGQSCISVQRVYVHESIYDQFSSDLASRVQALKTGSPFDPEVDVPSVVSSDSLNRISAWINEAHASGARVMAGGDVAGSILTPTLIADAAPEMKVMSEEIFGPAVAVARYKNLDEALELVNASRYGLMAGIFTSNIHKAMKAAMEIESGGVQINDIPTFRPDHIPYGGVKESGIGKEGPSYAMQEMSDIKVVIIRL